VPQRSEGELPEFSIRGPFGGINSETSVSAIEATGFMDCENRMFRKGEARVRPRLSYLPLEPSLAASVRIMDLVGTIEEQEWSPASVLVTNGLPEPWVGVADFDTVKGDTVQVAMTPSRLLKWSGNGWSPVGGGFTGTFLDRFATAVVAEKLLFSQGVDKVQVWDGITSGFDAVSPDAVPANVLFELDRRLIAANTIEGGERAFQRVRWTGPLDPADWTSFSAGQIDLFNDLGPINGGAKLGLYGFLWQKKGIVQVVPTGVGTRPFAFIAMSSRSKGLVYPGTLAVSGETQACYVGKDNIYRFDGSSSESIGDFPLSGRQRIGARSRIFSDLSRSNKREPLGYYSSAIKGNPFNAYWLVIPQVCTWVLNFDELNWTRWTWDKKPTIIGDFVQLAGTRIKDLIGTIGEQQWFPYGMVNDEPSSAVFLGFADGAAGMFDFADWCERDWFIQTGQLVMGDYRHDKTVKKLRIVMLDTDIEAIKISLTNEEGQVWVPDFGLLGSDGTLKITSSNKSSARTLVLNPSVSGMYHVIKISGSPGAAFSMSELTPIYSTGGERRSG
jgi:hypothetical protein